MALADGGAGAPVFADAHRREPRTLDEALDVIADLRMQLAEIVARPAHEALGCQLGLWPMSAIVVSTLWRAHPNPVNERHILAAMQEWRTHWGRPGEVDERNVLATTVCRLNRMLREREGFPRAVIRTRRMAPFLQLTADAVLWIESRL